MSPTDKAHSPAMKALLDYEQGDGDGIMVLASRQAIHEVAASHDDLYEALDKLNNVLSRQAVNEIPMHVHQMVGDALRKARNGGK